VNVIDELEVWLAVWSWIHNGWENI
jgi:hypothetical protein